MKAKLRQIKIHSFGRECVADGKISSENLDANIITLTDNFMFYAFECYKNEKLIDGQLVDEIIKVMLPNTEEAAKLEWEDGLMLSGNRYYAWFASTGGMKKENSGKCETIFIREDYRTFAEEFENQLISLGKFNEIANSQEPICINKDILSRISLGTSSCYMAGDMPNIIVLPQDTYPIIRDYKTINKIKGDPVQYDLVNYPYNKEIDVFDGGAIAGNGVFKQIQKELKLDYQVDFAIIRGFGIGIKGMITRFSIMDYLAAHYNEDTEYVRKVDGKYQLLDRWKDWQTVTDKTMLLNESMVKLAKYFTGGMTEYKENLANVDDKYKDIIGKLYVTKVNKSDKEIESYRRTNYQLISALGLTAHDYFNLITDEVKSYQNILIPFVLDENKEWKENADAIQLFFKNILNSNGLDEEELAEEIKRTSENVGTKCEELLHISQDFVKLRYVRTTLARLIEKRCREIAAAKFTVKAKYQYIAVCPISYMNFAMYRNQGSEGLNAGEFYSGDCQQGDSRTIARNPLCAYSEIHNVSFLKNDFLVKWLSPCRELIYFNQKSDILALMSSADTDGDAVTTIDNEIIRNAVVVPEEGKYFINKNDGEKELMMYIAQNRFYATYRASGNLIGKIALKAATINQYSQETLSYYDIENNKFIRFSDIVIEIGTHYVLTDEEKNEYIYKSRIKYGKEKIDNGEWLTTIKAAEQQREHIKQRFYENEKDIYIVLYNAMVSIDSPKTLYMVSPEDMEVINQKYSKKAHFLQYTKPEDEYNWYEYERTNGLLDKMADHLKSTLLDKIDVINQNKKKIYDQAKIIQDILINGDYDQETYATCSADITNLYQAYAEDREVAEKVCKDGITKLKKKRKIKEDDGSWNDDWKLDEYNAEIKKLKDERYAKYKEIDSKYIVQVDEIMGKFDMATTANAIGTLKNCTEPFIINLFYRVFDYLNHKLKSERYKFIQDDNGEVHYLGQRYRKEAIGYINNSNIVKRLHIDEKERLKVIRVNAVVRVFILDQSTVKLIQAEVKSKGHVLFDAKMSNNKVRLSRDGKDMFDVFSRQEQIGNYSLFNCSSLKVEIISNVKPKSLEFTITEIIE